MIPNFPLPVTIIFPDSRAPAFEASHRMQPAISSVFPALPSGEIRSTYSSGVSCSDDLKILPVISDGYTATLSAQDQHLTTRICLEMSQPSAMTLKRVLCFVKAVDICFAMCVTAALLVE